MSEDRHDNAVMVQGDVGETMRAEEEREEQGEGKEELQTDEELKERVVSRQEEKGKGEVSASEEDIIDSELPPASRQRIKKKAKAGKQKEPNLYNLSKQLERHTKQLSNMESTVQQFPKYLKNTVIQSSILKQLNTSINQLQKQVGQIQKAYKRKANNKNNNINSEFTFDYFYLLLI